VGGHNLELLILDDKLAFCSLVALSFESTVLLNQL
jgi:hypothetical protein